MNGFARDDLCAVGVGGQGGLNPKLSNDFRGSMWYRPRHSTMEILCFQLGSCKGFSVIVT